MSEPLSREREGGIRLYRNVLAKEDPSGLGAVGILDDLLAEIDRLRTELRGIKTQVSVHERRGRVARAQMFTPAGKEMLLFAVECAEQVVSSRPNEFSPEDVAALAGLKGWFEP